MSDIDNIGYDDMGNYTSFVPGLDGQEYQPAPFVVEDTREGYDQDGNWHCNGAGMDTPYTPNFPYRLAAQIQEHIQQEVSTSDYTIGRAERDDMAIDVANGWFNDQTFEPADIAFEALAQWRRIYGGNDGR